MVELSDADPPKQPIATVRGMVRDGDDRVLQFDVFDDAVRYFTHHHLETGVPGHLFVEIVSEQFMMKRCLHTVPPCEPNWPEIFNVAGLAESTRGSL